MKHFFTAACLLCTSLCLAQPQNVYYFKTNGDPTEIKDSADFIRIVRGPEAGSQLYPVAEYYVNGNQKLAGQSLTIDPPNFDGPAISFFRTGKRSAILNYTKGRLMKSYEYYPNGKLYQYKEYPEKSLKEDRDASSSYGGYLLQEANDSTGNSRVKGGNGYYTGYNDDFTRVTEEGPVKDGKNDGEWKGSDEKTGTTFTETYSNGVLIAGVARHNNNVTTYDKIRDKRPEYPSGVKGLYNYIGNRIRYPAADREKGVQGTVYLSFIVEKDGSLTDIRVTRSVSPAIDAEALKILNLSSKWVPGTRFGLPVRVKYSLPIKFALARE